MTLPDIQIFLICKSCDKVERCNTLRILERLREQHMLRRNVAPDEDLIRALLAQAVDSMACVSCGQFGLSLSDSDPMDELDWGNEKKPSKKCEGCRQPIPAERLEIFPDTVLCMECQSGIERGEPLGDEVEYCERCGDIMVLKQSTSRGYRMVCRACGK